MFSFSKQALEKNQNDFALDCVGELLLITAVKQPART